MTCSSARTRNLAISGAVESMKGDASQYPRRLVGAAGTGKTQVLSKIALDSNAITLAPTNKACAVLRSRGVPAVTIHSQIYAPEEVSLKEDLAALQEAALSLDEGDEKLKGMEAEIEAIEERLLNTPKGSRLRFSFRSENRLKGRNVIIDEASMVGKRTLGDILLSGTRNVLLVGDPGQLPPINQEDCLRSMPPNWTLVTQHRTGEAKDLVEIANLVRVDGADVALKKALEMSDSAESPISVLPRGSSNMAEKEMLAHAADNEDTVWLCWKNQTRLEINRGIRERLKRSDDFPQARDRLVAYSKDGSDKGRWYNGSSAVVDSVEAEDVSIMDGFTFAESKGRKVIVRIDGNEPEPVSCAYERLHRGMVERRETDVAIRVLPYSSQGSGLRVGHSRRCRRLQQPAPGQRQKAMAVYRPDKGAKEGCVDKIATVNPSIEGAKTAIKSWASSDEVLHAEVGLDEAIARASTSPVVCNEKGYKETADLLAEVREKRKGLVGLYETVSKPLLMLKKIVSEPATSAKSRAKEVEDRLAVLLVNYKRMRERQQAEEMERERKEAAAEGEGATGSRKEGEGERRA